MKDLTADLVRRASLGPHDLMDTPREAFFDAIVEQAAAATQAPIAMIRLIDNRRQWFKATLGLDGNGDAADRSICGDAIRMGRTHVVPDASIDPRYRDFADVKGGLGIRFYAGVPLETQGGTRLGTLCVIDVAARAGLEDDQRDALEALARRTVAAFELRHDMLARGGAQLLDNSSAPGDVITWLDQTTGLLAKASAALDQVGATLALAQLESVIASVDALRRKHAPA